MKLSCTTFSSQGSSRISSGSSRTDGCAVFSTARWPRQQQPITIRADVRCCKAQIMPQACTSSSHDPPQQQHNNTNPALRWAAAFMCSGALLWAHPSQAAATLPPQLVLLDTNSSSGNAAIMSQLKQLQQTKQKFGTQDPGAALAARFAGVQQQLQRIELLVKIQQYDTARMQLRQGSFKSLRSDLRYESEYRGVQPELARNIIEGVEKLDRQLRGQETTETIADGLKQLQQQLQQLVDDAQPPP